VSIPSTVDVEAVNGTSMRALTGDAQSKQPEVYEKSLNFHASSIHMRFGFRAFILIFCSFLSLSLASSHLLSGFVALDDSDSNTCNLHILDFQSTGQFSVFTKQHFDFKSSFNSPDRCWFTTRVFGTVESFHVIRMITTISGLLSRNFAAESNLNRNGLGCIRFSADMIRVSELHMNRTENRHNLRKVVRPFGSEKRAINL
jgi:hypothetical protein